MTINELAQAVADQRIEGLLAMRPPRPKTGWMLVPVIDGAIADPVFENTGRRALVRDLLEVFRQATCIGCGCDDLHPSSTDSGTCAWLRLDIHAGLGVCSACREHVDRWDTGDRTLTTPPVAEVA